MNHLFFGVGPSQLYPTVQRHVHDAFSQHLLSISHRSDSFTHVYARTQAALHALLGIPNSHRIFFLSSGTEAMERIIQNGSAVNTMHIVNGAFSQRWHTIATQLGRNAHAHAALTRENLTPTVPSETELLCITHNETSIGLSWPEPDITHLAQQHPHTLIAVDIVSSAPYAHLDYAHIDYAFFSVQKGFGLPAGLAVLIASPRAMEKADELRTSGYSTGSYHSFQSLRTNDDKHGTSETPNMLGIYLLGRVAEDMQQHGIQRIRRSIIDRAHKMYAFFDQHPRYQVPQVDPHLRSATTLVTEVIGGSQPIISELKQHGIHVNAGYKEYGSAHIRIGNYPAHSDTDVDALLSYLEKTS